jgi:succinate dehydrogenase hydrophobic anchor subunit
MPLYNLDNKEIYMKPMTFRREEVVSDSGHQGTSAWLSHRISFLLLLPFTVWALFVMVPGLSHLFSVSQHIRQDVKEWVSVPLNGVPLVLWLFLLLYHAMLSVHTMIEDYIPVPWIQKICIILLKGISYALMGLVGIGILRLWLF